MKTKKTQKADLENKRGLFFQIGMITAISVTLVAFNWSSDNESATLAADNREYIPDDVIPITEPEQPKPQEIAPAPIISDEIKIVDDNVKIDDVVDFTSEDDKNFVLQNVNYVENPKIEDEKIDDNEIIPFFSIEEKPTFMGGDQNKFRIWVNKNVKYPEDEVANGIEGKVILQFVVDKDGSVKGVKVLRSSQSSALDNEAVRVISSSPKWTAGRQNKKPASVIFQFPVIFKLQ